MYVFRSKKTILASNMSLNTLLSRERAKTKQQEGWNLPAFSSSPESALTIKKIEVLDD